MTMDTFCCPRMDLTFPTRLLLILYNTVPKGKQKKDVPPYCTEFYIQSTTLHSLIYTPYIYWCRRHETMETVLARTFHPTIRQLLIKPKPNEPATAGPRVQTNRENTHFSTLPPKFPTLQQTRDTTTLLWDTAEVAFKICPSLATWSWALRTCCSQVLLQQFGTLTGPSRWTSAIPSPGLERKAGEVHVSSKVTIVP